ncbi:helix-turn-helix domain-containing protein [Pusillimonas sp. TS35]|uniref:IclR family transcriptional regulator n=1 Tax=Paracandidimonas lactea TaxID=2895524 RepID=UPI00136AA907|nr:IclR family transcriptional regulator [Paracandidimonas lactea]MYN14776.1 helix-turn-helix domain-containing protein [Pusillimonas sp. TS35]
MKAVNTPSPRKATARASVRAAAPDRGESNVKTALRVIEIIEIFAREARPLALSELARHLDAPVSSCLALLRTLVSLGYLYEIGRRQGYYPTGRLQAMARRISRADPILEKLLPTLEALRDATSETVVLGKVSPGNEVVYLEVLPSPNPISYVAVPGDKKMLHANSLGKALLSTMESDERARLLAAPLQGYSDRTLNTPARIEADIQVSLARGWFANLGESLPDLGAIAWPLSISGSHYAISVAGPLYRIESNLDDYVHKLRVACRAIEQGMQP